MRYQLVVDDEDDYCLVDAIDRVRTQYFHSRLDACFNITQNKYDMSIGISERFLDKFSRMIICEFDEVMRYQKFKELYPEVFI